MDDHPGRPFLPARLAKVTAFRRAPLPTSLALSETQVRPSGCPPATFRQTPDSLAIGTGPTSTRR